MKAKAYSWYNFAKQVKTKVYMNKLAVESASDDVYVVKDHTKGTVIWLEINLYCDTD